MKKNAIGVAFAGYAAISMGAAYGNPDEIALDVSTVTKIVVTGEASTVKLTTADDIPHMANLRSLRKGWFVRWQSGWFSGDCKPVGAMHIKDKTLFINVPSSSFFDFSDCTVELSANVPSGIGVSIDQKALMANLSGDFSDVTVRGKAADISLVGHASRVDVEGEAIRTQLDFGNTDKTDEDIRIIAKALDVYVKFPDGTPVDYQVDATASFVDSKLANTPGAKSSVRINGEFVRATIR